jgi:nickel-type superoxide dismutase maturation protease
LLGRAVVEGRSMEPVFQPGDRVLFVRTRRATPGRVVVVADPRDPSRLLIKRVRQASRLGLDVRGDNEAASTDSRSFGLVAGRAVRGRVLYRYAPGERAGWL